MLCRTGLSNMFHCLNKQAKKQQAQRTKNKTWSHLSYTFIIIHLQTESCRTKALICNNYRYILLIARESSILLSFSLPEIPSSTVSLSSGKEFLPPKTHDYILPQMASGYHVGSLFPVIIPLSGTKAICSIFFKGYGNSIAY